MSRSTIWQRGYTYITRLGDETRFAYSIRECRIAAMAFEAGWRAALRTKEPAAVELGRLGGLKGGLARAASLTAEQRSEIARKAAQTRWGNR